jgi:hypothetical protein
MKPDFARLYSQLNKDDFAIAAVDCTGSGSALCSSHGVSGFPTIKYFADFEAEGEVCV